ncbi:hypothetical protein L9F63_010471, partial [Diploptera punctata]
FLSSTVCHYIFCYYETALPFFSMGGDSDGSFAILRNYLRYLRLDCHKDKIITTLRLRLLCPAGASDPDYIPPPVVLHVMVLPRSAPTTLTLTMVVEPGANKTSEHALTWYQSEPFTMASTSNSLCWLSQNDLTCTKNFKAPDPTLHCAMRLLPAVHTSALSSLSRNPLRFSPSNPEYRGALPTTTPTMMCTRAPLGRLKICPTGASSFRGDTRVAQLLLHASEDASRLLLHRRRDRLSQVSLAKQLGQRQDRSSPTWPPAAWVPAGISLSSLSSMESSLYMLAIFNFPITINARTPRIPSMASSAFPCLPALVTVSEGDVVEFVLELISLKTF